MPPGALGVFPVVLAAVAGSGLILSNSRVVRLAMLALQYSAAAWLISFALPIQVAVVKLVAGLLACGILALSVSRFSDSASVHTPPGTVPVGLWFRSLGVMMVLSGAYGLAQTDWLGIPNITQEATVGATILMGLGMLQIGFSTASLRIGTGLMTLVSGFEIVYGSIEPSLAVLAMLGSLHLGFALVISYLLYASDSASDRGEGRP